MSDQFKALIINQEGDNFTREIKSIDKTNDLSAVINDHVKNMTGAFKELSEN